jgi:hypothetical protein
MHLYLTCTIKLSIQIINFQIINQHKIDICHVQSLEKGLLPWHPCLLLPCFHAFDKLIKTCTSLYLATLKKVFHFLVGVMNTT